MFLRQQEHSDESSLWRAVVGTYEVCYNNTPTDVCLSTKLVSGSTARGALTLLIAMMTAPGQALTLITRRSDGQISVPSFLLDQCPFLCLPSSARPETALSCPSAALYACAGTLCYLLDCC